MIADNDTLDKSNEMKSRRKTGGNFNSTPHNKK